MAGNQTDAKNRAKRALDTQEDALRNMHRQGANSNQIREQQRRVDSARATHTAAVAAENAALDHSAKCWF